MFTHEVASLQRIPMFREVDVAKLKLIAMTGERLRYEPGDTILQQGAPSSALFILMDGEADVYRETDGARVKVVRLSGGALVGEIGAVLDQPYSGTIIAATPVTALQIDRGTFFDLLREVPQLSMALIRELARRVVKTTDLLAKASNKT